MRCASLAHANKGFANLTTMVDPREHVSAVPKKLDQELIAGDAVHPSHEPERFARDLRLDDIARDLRLDGIALVLRHEGERFVGWCAKGGEDTAN